MRYHTSFIAVTSKPVLWLVGVSCCSGWWFSVLSMFVYRQFAIWRMLSHARWKIDL